MLFIASQLTYLAFVANFGTLITVVFVLGAMILFIRQFRYCKKILFLLYYVHTSHTILITNCRLYEFEPTASSLVLVKKPKVKKLLNKVEMPFSLNLGQAHTTSLGKIYKYYGEIIMQSIVIFFLFRKSFRVVFKK